MEEEGALERGREGAEVRGVVLWQGKMLLARTQTQALDVILTYVVMETDAGLGCYTDICWHGDKCRYWLIC